MPPKCQRECRNPEPCIVPDRQKQHYPPFSSAKGHWANTADKCNSEGQLSKQMKCMFSSQPCNANQYILSKNDNFRFLSCTWMKKALVLKTCKVIFSSCPGQWGQPATLRALPNCSMADLEHMSREWIRHSRDVQLCPIAEVPFVHSG